MEQIDFADIRPGDRITMKSELNGIQHALTATVRERTEETLFVGEGGEWHRSSECQFFIELPPLPTERPAFIIATEVRGVTGEWLMVLDDEGDWQVVHQDDREVPAGWSYAEPHEVTVWRPAKVVAA